MPHELHPKPNDDPPKGALPQRVLVRRDPTRARTLHPVSEIAERTPVGDAYLDSLIGAQFSLALRMLVVLCLILVGLPTLLALAPDLEAYKIMGVPIGWFLIGGLLYPLFLLLAVVFVYRSEHNEAEFVEFVSAPRSLVSPIVITNSPQSPPEEAQL